MESIFETVGTTVFVVLPLVAVLFGYLTYRGARRAEATNPVWRGVGTAVVLLFAFPVTFGIVAAYVGSDWSYRALYFAPLLFLGVALYLFSAPNQSLFEKTR